MWMKRVSMESGRDTTMTSKHISAKLQIVQAWREPVLMHTNTGQVPTRRAGKAVATAKSDRVHPKVVGLRTTTSPHPLVNPPHLPAICELMSKSELLQDRPWAFLVIGIANGTVIVVGNMIGIGNTEKLFPP